MKLKRIHCVLEFDQSQWLAKYVDFNTTCRKQTDFEKDFYKLMDIVFDKNDGKFAEQGKCETRYL